MKRKIFEWLTRPFTALFQHANRANVSFAERIHPVYKVDTKIGTLQFSCPNNLTLWRARTFFTKEPHTIEWINGFSEHDILFDIGANVGTYSIYAAAKGIQVFSFEPESQNYATLNKNIYLNSAQNKVNALNIAISNESNIGHLFIKEFTIGGALNNFGESLDYNKKSFTPGFKQAVSSYKLDDLIENSKLPVPNHIKIDVDGIEPLVISGAIKLLQNPKVKSLLIEINTKLDDHVDIVNILKNNNFVVKQRHCVTNDNNSEFKDCYNYIFERA